MNWDKREKIKGDKILKLLIKNGYILDKEVAMDYWFTSDDINSKDTKIKFWDGEFKNDIKKNYKISFCTTCMDRLYNLKETLPKNIKDNGGLTIVQDPKDCQVDTMTTAALNLIEPNHIYKTEQIIAFLKTLR